MLGLALLNADAVREQFALFQSGRPVEDGIPLVDYPEPAPRKAPIVILRQNTQCQPTSQPTSTKMPFPMDSDSDFDEMHGEAVEADIKPTKETVAKPPKPEVTFERISSTMYKQNEAAIKSGLQSNEAFIYTKYPGGKPVAAERFASSVPFNVFTLPAFAGNVDLVYRTEDFPLSFVSFQDRNGERWKAVALWDNEKKKIFYVCNVNAEIRLCSELYTGSSKGKVRWEKAVEPRNNIPSNFGSFAVSDRVLLDRRKAHWPEALKKLREGCNGGLTVTERDFEEEKPEKEEKPKKVKAEKKEKVEKADGEKAEKAEKAEKGEKAEKKPRKPVVKTEKLDDAGDDAKDKTAVKKPAASRKRKADTYLQIVVTGKSRLVYTASAGDSLTVEEITLNEGNPLARNIFTV